MHIRYDYLILLVKIDLLVNLVANRTAFKIYRSYAEEDSEESREDVTCDYTFEPCGELLRQERSEAIFGALDELSYREREVIRSHIGFCPDCHGMKSPKFRPHTFQEIVYKNELSSAEAAENIYHKGLDKMRVKLKKKGIYHP